MLCIHKLIAESLNKFITLIQVLLNNLNLLLLCLNLSIELLCLKNIPSYKTSNRKNKDNSHNPQSTLVRSECLLAEKVQTLGHTDATNKALLTLRYNKAHKRSARRKANLITRHKNSLIVYGLTIN